MYYSYQCDRPQSVRGHQDRTDHHGQTLPKCCSAPPSPPCTTHNGPASQIARRTCAWKPREDRKTETDIAFGKWGFENDRYSLRCHLERIRALVNGDFGCFKWLLFYVSRTAWHLEKNPIFHEPFHESTHQLMYLCILIYWTVCFVRIWYICMMYIQWWIWRLRGRESPFSGQPKIHWKYGTLPSIEVLPSIWQVCWNLNRNIKHYIPDLSTYIIYRIRVEKAPGKRSKLDQWNLMCIFVCCIPARIASC